MILKDVLREGTNILRVSGIDAPALEAGVILCHVIKRDKTFLYAHDDYILTGDEYENYNNLLEQRVKGLPLQYITGNQEFMSLNFKVGREVLIPRGDTEVLVEAVIKYVDDLNNGNANNLNTNFLNNKNILNNDYYKKDMPKEGIKILDIGTGSGCISVSLAHYIENSRIFALDLSPEALRLALYNARTNEVEDKISFINGDIFRGIKEALGDEKGMFDVIVSNPPYIPRKTIETLEVQVKHYEPYMALNGGEDGLDFYRVIVKEGVANLCPGGLLAFEVGIDQYKDVADMMKDSFENIKVLKDYSGIQRVVMGNLKNSELI